MRRSRLPLLVSLSGHQLSVPDFQNAFHREESGTATGERICERTPVVEQLKRWPTVLGITLSSRNTTSPWRVCWLAARRLTRLPRRLHHLRLSGDDDLLFRLGTGFVHCIARGYGCGSQVYLAKVRSRSKAWRILRDKARILASALTALTEGAIREQTRRHWRPAPWAQ